MFTNSVTSENQKIIEYEIRHIKTNSLKNDLNNISH